MNIGNAKTGDRALTVEGTEVGLVDHISDGHIEINGFGATVVLPVEYTAIRYDNDIVLQISDLDFGQRRRESLQSPTPARETSIKLGHQMRLSLPFTVPSFDQILRSMSLWKFRRAIGLA